MAVISKEQRMAEIKDRAEMMNNTETMGEDEKKELAANLATRDRLMRRLDTIKIITTFKDDLGSFIIESRMMKGAERERFMALNKALADAKGDADQYNRAMAGLKEVAAGVCLTKGLDREFWTGGDVSDDVVLTVLLNAFNGQAKAVIEGVEQFRPK